MTVTPVTELDVWRVEVAEDAQHQRSMRLGSAVMWLAAGPNPQGIAQTVPVAATIDLPGRRKFVTRAIPNAAFCQPGAGDIQTTIASGAPVPLSTIDTKSMSFAPSLTRLGIRDFLWPLPAQLRLHAPAALPSGQVTWVAGPASAPTLHYAYTTRQAWPGVFTQDFQLGNVSIPATFDITADGTGEGDGL